MTSSRAWNRAIENEHRRGEREHHVGLLGLVRWLTAMAGLKESGNAHENSRIPNDAELNVRRALKQLEDLRESDIHPGQLDT